MDYSKPKHNLNRSPTDCWLCKTNGKEESFKPKAKHRKRLGNPKSCANPVPLSNSKPIARPQSPLRISLTHVSGGRACTEPEAETKLAATNHGNRNGTPAAGTSALKQTFTSVPILISFMRFSELRILRNVSASRTPPRPGGRNLPSCPR